jgi:hypothetical protein
MMTLSARDTKVFVAAVLNPATPSTALRAAARDYKTRVGRRARTA